MKLLFDENLSPRLSQILSTDYPGSIHVRDVDLLRASDRKIWDYSRKYGFVIVSKDTDFRERSFVEGFPPKIIWLDVGNADTNTIADLLRRKRVPVEAFEQQDDASFLVLSLNSRTI